jgi:hypothetical protein
MITYTVEPWPSTYEMMGERKPFHLKSKYGRTVAAMRGAIPPRTIEPPQIHLIAPRDGQPFEELLTAFELPFQVAMYDINSSRITLREYSPGENILLERILLFQNIKSIG